jgi:thiol:disulfide interchange protein
MYKRLFTKAPVMLIAILSLVFMSIIHTDVTAKETNPSSQGIKFIEADWNKALAEAKKQHKLIFLDAYTTWCGPCKLLKRKTFPDKAAGAYYNENFINVAVDMEKGQGPALLKRYGVDAFPTLIITDENGNLVTYTKGYMKPADLIEFGKHGFNKYKK